MHALTMTEPVFEGMGNLPDTPTFACINRVDLPTVQALEHALGRVAWLVDANCMPDKAILNYLFGKHAPGYQGNMNTMQRHQMDERIGDMLSGGNHVVFITSSPTQARGALCDLPPHVLNYLDDTSLPVLPIYAAWSQPDMETAMTPPDVNPEGEGTDAGEARLCLRLMPQLPPGAAMGARLRNAWMEASADHLAALPVLRETSLPQLLVNALLQHKDAKLIDGVDDSVLLYSDLLLLALILAGKLRALTHDKRLGIILPPGKRAAIANLACLLAGIAPINLNYTLNQAEARSQIAQAGVTRFITEERFRMMQEDYAWPSERDLLDVDSELQDTESLRKSFRLLCRRKRSKPALLLRTLRLLRLLDLPEISPDDEVSLFFTAGTEAPPRAVPVSQRMLLASLLQLHNRLNMSPGQPVLSALPCHQPMGFIHGLLLPLLFGYGIVTYPSPTAGIRLATLIAENQVRFVPATPEMAEHLLASFDEANRRRLAATTPQLAQAQQEGRLHELFAPLHYLLIGKSPISSQLEKKALLHFRLYPLSAYTLTEAAPMATLNLPPYEGGYVDADGPHPPAIPSYVPRSVGAPLPGVAVRITDLGREGKLLPPGHLGLIWLKGANLAPRYQGQEESMLLDQWYNTGDVGYQDEAGMLHIAGRRRRFSSIGGVLVPHEQLEAKLAIIFKVPEDAGIKVAVVAVPDPRDGEQLVMLSTLHEGCADFRITTAMRYDIRNEVRLEQWIPQKLIPVDYIPTLPDGTVNYPFCYRGVCQLLGINS